MLRIGSIGWLVSSVLALGPVAAADDPPLAEYFRAETGRIAARPLAGIESREDWEARRPELRRQLAEMLGLWPEPPRTPLEPRITGTLDRPDFRVEKLLFQSAPGLYVTGNLYLPKQQDGPAPAILYVCGHAKVEKDGVIFGNKAHYQHHAAWFAANGYVCLVVDTLQLGELPGLHHGTNRFGMWWWPALGYTPAGIEAWNGIRAIDYLVSRPEVDPERIGMTGRSGGGATSWWVAALDDRVKAAIPVAGITDLEDHVVDGVVKGHCDCMYFVNTYRWDFPLVAALVAPRPLLVVNTDSDPIFPEDGVRRINAQLEKVYGWYDARDRLGLVIGKGGHIDSAEVRHPAFAFMDRWLLGRDRPIEEPDRKIPVEELKVLAATDEPADSRNAMIHESFLRPAEAPPVPDSPEAWRALRERYLDDVRRLVFAGWPAEDATLTPGDAITRRLESGKGRPGLMSVRTQDGVEAWIAYVLPPGDLPLRLRVAVVDEADGPRFAEAVAAIERGEDPDLTLRMLAGSIPDARISPGVGLAWIAPRGVGPGTWPTELDTHVRRRFPLLGQSLDGMRVWDVLRVLDAIRSEPGLGATTIELSGRGGAAQIALWAAVLDPEVASLRMVDPPPSFRRGPSFLNVERIFDAPQAVAMMHPRPVAIVGNEQARGTWSWAVDLARILGGPADWPRFEPAPGEAGR